MKKQFLNWYEKNQDIFELTRAYIGASIGIFILWGDILI